MKKRQKPKVRKTWVKNPATQVHKNKKEKRVKKIDPYADFEIMDDVDGDLAEFENRAE